MSLQIMKLVKILLNKSFSQLMKYPMMIAKSYRKAIRRPELKRCPHQLEKKLKRKNSKQIRECSLIEVEDQMEILQKEVHFRV